MLRHNEWRDTQVLLFRQTRFSAQSGSRPQRAAAKSASIKVIMAIMAHYSARRRRGH